MGRTKLVALLCAVSHLLSAAQPEELARHARNAMAAAKYSEAVAIYRQLLHDEPGNAGLRFNYALALHSAGNFTEAIPQLERVTREQSQLTNAWLVLGLAYRKLGKPEMAIAPLEHVAKLEPGNDIALLELADAYLSTGRTADAAKYFQTLSARNPSSPKPLQGLGTSFVSLARQMFEQLNAEAPDSPFTAALLAKSRFEQGQYRTAFSLACQSRVANPPIPDVDTLIAAIYRASGHADWAAAVLAKAPKSESANCAPTDLACLFIADRIEELVGAASRSHTPYSLYWQSRAYSLLAKKALDRLNTLPESAEMHEVLGESFRLQDRKEDSVREWREAVRLAPGDTYAVNGLARALWLHRDYADAQPLVEQLLKTSPEAPELNYELGDMLLEQQSVEEALPFLRKAISAGLQTGAVHGALGLALLKTGKAQEAIPHLQAALPGDVDGSLHHQLGRAWQQLGDDRKARQYFDEQARIAGRLSEKSAVPEPAITPP